ncbi:MAG: hypothetical protein IT258_22545 [Saprospiraceae bacterium]|nr:hypothetical protein [Saprospiraceae bacterium]
MTIKNTKTTFAAFEVKEIKIAQQLQVKGGEDTVKPTPIIGSEDIIHV